MVTWTATLTCDGCGKTASGEVKMMGHGSCGGGIFSAGPSPTFSVTGPDGWGFAGLGEMKLTCSMACIGKVYAAEEKRQR